MVQELTKRLMAPSSVQVTQWLTQWEVERRQQGKNDRVSKNYRQYVTAFRLFVRRYCGADLDSEDDTMLQQALIEFAKGEQGVYGSRVSDSTMQAKLSAIRVFYNWLMEIGERPAHWLNFSGVIHSKAVQRVSNPVSSAEECVEALMRLPRDTAVGLRDFCLLGLLGYAGFNGNGVVHLTYKDFSPENRHISIPVISSGSSRERGRTEVDLPVEFSDAIETYIQWAYLGDETIESPLFPRMNKQNWQAEPTALSEMMVYFIMTKTFGTQKLKHTVSARRYVAEFERAVSEVGSLA